MPQSTTAKQHYSIRNQRAADGDLSNTTAMTPSVVLLTWTVAVVAVVIAAATIRTKARQRKIRKALGLPGRMRTSTAEAQARHAVRVFEATSKRLTTTAKGVSKEERRKMAIAIVKEKGLLPKVSHASGGGVPGPDATAREDDDSPRG